MTPIALALLCGGVTLALIVSLGRLPEEAPLWLRLLCPGAGAMTAYLTHRAKRIPATLPAHGSAGFADAEEEAFLHFPSAASLPIGAVLLGKRNDTLLALPPPYTTQHGVIVGGSGTGKSFGFFLPNLAHARGVSVVATDPKSELWAYTSGYHASTRLAPNEPEASAGFNWIPLCQDARLASLCARAVVEAGETERQEAPWPDLETAFLAALFSHTATLSAPTPLSAYHLLTRSEPEALMQRFLESPSWVAREQAIIFHQTHERMRGSITPVLAAKLQFLRDPKVARFTSASLAAPDLGRLRLNPSALYWCVREQDMALLRPLSSLFFTLLLDQLAHESVSEREAVPVHLYLDEFANIGVIPHYDTAISLARGRGLSLWHGIQSLSQLEARYGKANAQTILTNCATKIALSGLDVETAHYFSRSLGEATISTHRSSWQRRRFALFSHGVNEARQEHSRLLLTPDEVRRIGEGEALIITGNRRPIRADKWFYAARPNAAATTALGPAQTLPMTEVFTSSSAETVSHETIGQPPKPPDKEKPVRRPFRATGRRGGMRSVMVDKAKRR